IETIYKLMKWCDVFLQNNVSFKLLWPLLLCRRPYVCVHHGFYAKYRQEVLPVRKWLKHIITLMSTNISVSHAVAASLPGKSYVITNPYRSDVFFRIPKIQKDRDLFFVGRMVSDKGLDLLIEAVAKLRGEGLETNLTVAGK